MNDADVEPFVDAYVIANTPEFLLVKILSNPVFDSLTARFTTEQLFEVLENANRAAGSPSDLLKGYVALVGLFKAAEKSEDVRERLRSWAPTRLRWAPAMLTYWDELRSPTTVSRLAFARAVSPKDAPQSDTSNTSVKIVVPS
jgi:hypothetical protein